MTSRYHRTTESSHVILDLVGIRADAEQKPPVRGGIDRGAKLTMSGGATPSNPFNNNPPSNTKGTSNSFTFGADAVETF
jgi:hypothetical protein